MDWISVKDKVPHYGQTVFVWDSSSYRSKVCVARGNSKEVVWENPYGDDEINVRHWMPMPWPYEEPKDQSQ